jgi:hypothetical protein
MKALLEFLQQEIENRESAGGDETDYVKEARDALDEAHVARELLVSAAVGLPSSTLKDRIKEFVGK